MIKYKEETYKTYVNQGYERVILEDGGVWYQLDGNFHREDGPAVIWESGEEFWFINGKRHREDGPAVTNPEGNEEYWLHGIEVIPEHYHLFSPLQLVKLELI